MENLQHENIVQLLATCSLPNEKNGLVLELLESNLQTILQSGWLRFSQKQLGTVALQVAKAMKYLSEKRIIHRDLACRNILVNSTKGTFTKVKLCDFGLSEELDPKSSSVISTSKFDVRITAPECVKLNQFTLQSDIWSFGILLHDIFSRGLELTSGEILSQISTSSIPKSIACLIQKCLSYDPLKRPTFSEIYRTLKSIVLNLEDSPSARKRERSLTCPPSSPFRTLVPEYV